MYGFNPARLVHISTSFHTASSNTRLTLRNVVEMIQPAICLKACMHLHGIQLGLDDGQLGFSCILLLGCALQLVLSTTQSHDLGLHHLYSRMFSNAESRTLKRWGLVKPAVVS